MIFSIRTVLLLTVFLGQSVSDQALFPGHSLGEMVGAVTDTDAILQSRLTAAEASGETFPGRRGEARFELSLERNFQDSFFSKWLSAEAENDFIVKTRIHSLQPATLYYYRLIYGPNRNRVRAGPTRSFRTLAGSAVSRPVRFVVVTGMNYHKFHYGLRDSERAYAGADRHLGYPGLEMIAHRQPDFFVGTGDNVYFDYPGGEQSATSIDELRRKYHEQFVQPRFIDLFSHVPTYWEKDDHDYRFNDCDNTGDRKPLPALGRKLFLEQLPVSDPEEDGPLTYGTFRISRELQIWLVEGRDYRSPNDMPDGPQKTIWGSKQKEWLKRTLLESDAAFKILISATPMVGPDDSYKRDNHTNPEGFRQEGEAFFRWLGQNGFLQKNFYIICGDRHWQYHSIHPSGFEEFSCGALVDANSRVGRLPGDPESTDPQALVKQPYCMLEPSGGFLEVNVTPGEPGQGSQATFIFRDEHGRELYSATKTAELP